MLSHYTSSHVRGDGPRIKKIGRLPKIIGEALSPLSRYIMTPDRHLVVDHINGNTLDNRRSNLRVLSRWENQRNRKYNQVNKTGYRGVRKLKGKWIASIYVGTFDTAEEAAKAYRESYEKLFPGLLKQE